MNLRLKLWSIFIIITVFGIRIQRFHAKPMIEY